MGERIPFGVIRRKVNKLLLDCNIEFKTANIAQKEGIAVDIEKIAACRKITIRYHPFSNDISGVFYKKDEKLFLGVNANHTPTRQRFTIAHEIGHHILHSDDILHFDNVEDIDRIYFRADKVQSAQETEANFFAAEILMPLRLIEKCVEAGIVYLHELSDCFQVSEEAMRYRLINLGYL